jgi:hypothetical protein
VSAGRRQSRRKRRAKRRRAELKELASTLPHELVTAGYTFGRGVWSRRAELGEPARTASNEQKAVVRALGRSVARSMRSLALSLSSAGRRAGREWAELRRLASTVFSQFIALVHAFGEGVGRLAEGVEWGVLFYALLGSLAGLVLSAIAGVASLMILFLLSSLLLYLALWKREP